MISIRAGKDPVSAHNSLATAGPSVPSSLTRQIFGRSVRRLHAAGRQYPAFAFAVFALSLSGVATAAAACATVQHLHSAQVQPLAPARPPVGPANATNVATHKRTHPLLRNFTVSSLRGIASWYGAVLHGHTTASGEVFNEAEMTACHRTLPFGTMVRVTDTDSRRSVVVRINDRGVLNADRVIDLSSGAAEKLGILRTGLAHVTLEVLKTKQPASGGLS